MAITDIQLVYVNDADSTDIVDSSAAGYSAYLSATSDSTAADTTWTWTGTTDVPTEHEYVAETNPGDNDGSAAISAVALSSVTNGTTVTISDGDTTSTFTVASGSAIDGAASEAEIVLGVDDNGNLVTVDSTSTTSITGNNESFDAVQISTTDISKSPRTAVDWYGDNAVVFTDTTSGQDTTYTISEGETQGLYNLSSSASGTVVTELNNIDSVYYSAGDAFNLQEVSYVNTDASATVYEATLWEDTFNLDLSALVTNDTVSISAGWVTDGATGDSMLSATYAVGVEAAGASYRVANLSASTDENGIDYYELTYTTDSANSIDSGAGNYDATTVAVVHLYDYDNVEVTADVIAEVARFSMPTTDVFSDAINHKVFVTDGSTVEIKGIVDLNDPATPLDDTDDTSYESGSVTDFETATDIIQLGHALTYVPWNTASSTDIGNGQFTVVAGTVATDETTGYDTFSITAVNPTHSLVIYDSNDDASLSTTSAILVDNPALTSDHVYVKGNGGSGTNDFVTVQDNIVATEVGDGNDQVLGSSSGDTVIGGGGNDTVHGGVGDDILIGGNMTPGDVQNAMGSDGELPEDTDTANGSDTLYGEQGNDTLLGGTGDDLLNGGNSGGYYFDESGNQTGEGINLLNGGEGNDIADYSDLPTGLYANVNLFVTQSSQETVTDGTDLYALDMIVDVEGVAGSAGDDDISGNGYNNTVEANGGADNISGGRGNDQLSGGAGNDTIHGGIGNDTIDGGAGADTMTGGIGADTFVFDLSELGDGGNHITDFNKWADTIKVTGTATSGGTSYTADSSSTLIANAGELILTTITGHLILAALDNYDTTAAQLDLSANLEVM